MITDRTAQRIASEWASGGDALQQLASTGAIPGDDHIETYHNPCQQEALACLNFLVCHPYPVSRSIRPGFTTRDKRDIENLLDYISRNGPRGPVDGWYERTIARQK